MVSVDVVSFFTTVPISLALQIINTINTKWSEIGRIHTTLDKGMFFEGQTLCLRNNYFQYRGDTYSHVEDSALVSSLSPIVAEIVLDTLFDDIEARFKDRVLYLSLIHISEPTRPY